ncbi:Tol-Pal system beta propeller repeat protein TolB [Desulfococcaceae bacterium HSG9]|nr:Tol-Pal system beta propeller repeat protein TolB [Desulfococcaceae bacterium HSG9]
MNLKSRFFKFMFKTTLNTAVSFFLLISAAQSAEYDYLKFTNPFIKKIPIAVPDLRNMNADPAVNELTRRGADRLSSNLAFTGFFKLLDRSAFLTDPQKNELIPSNIKFKNWTAIRAEYLVTGSIKVFEGDMIEVEFRLYDTFRENLKVGKRYKGWKNDLDRMVRRFSNEIVFNLTGIKGIFNSKIAFISKKSKKKDIYICDFDGSNAQRYTKTQSITLSPAWSSDGQWIAYTSYVRGKPDLYIRNIIQKHGVVIRKKGSNITPDWVPGRFELAASLSFSGDPEIYLLTGKGKVVKRLTNNRGIDISPSWSPDGKKIAFVSKRSGTPQLHIKNISSGGLQRLTFVGKQNTQPCWSPKGDRIAYSGMLKGLNQILVISSKGGDPVQLTFEGDNESPSWSPDGNLIVFSSTREGVSRIYVMTAIGTDQRRLIALPGQQSEPSWSPAFSNN